MDRMASDNVCTLPYHLKESAVGFLRFKPPEDKLTVTKRNDLLLTFISTEAGRSATIIGDENNSFIIRCPSEAMEVFIDLAQEVVKAAKQGELQTREVRKDIVCDMVRTDIQQAETQHYPYQKYRESRS